MRLPGIFRKGDNVSRPHNDTPGSEELPPQNPLAPTPRAGDESPASFTPMQLGPASQHSGGAPSIHGSDSTVRTDALVDVKAELLANWLHTKQEERVWTFGSAGEGVFMKKSRGRYSCAPDALRTDGTGLIEAVTELNVRVSLTTPNTRTALSLILCSAL